MHLLAFSDLTKSVADPGGASIGATGAPVGTAGAGERSGSAAALDKVASSALPAIVKSRLTSDAHRRFIDRCQPAALDLQDWRKAVLQRPGRPESLDAALAALDSTEQRRLADLIRTYTAACLVPSHMASEPRLARFIETRVGLIQTSDGSPVCTATLLTPDTIITARHCVSSPRDERVVRDLTQLSFALVRHPGAASRLTMATVRSEYYAGKDGLGFDRGELQSDLVILTLADAIAPTAPGPPETFTVAEPTRYGQLHAVSFNLYSYRAAQIRDGVTDWSGHVYVDPSATCMAAGRYGPRLVLHACQTEGASSGAPLVTLPEDGGPVTLAAIHTGGFVRHDRHPKVWSEAGIDTRLVPNHAVVVFGRVKDRIHAWLAATPPAR